MYGKIASFVIVALLWAGSAHAQQVVVLKNGNVIQGVVQQEGDRVEVRSSLTSRIVLKRHEINYVCDSLNEAYQLIQAESNPDSVDSQVEVFRWCMRHQLLDQAQLQIDVLQLMPIDRGQLAFLNRQVQSAIAQRAKKMQRERQQQIAAAQPAMNALTPKRSTDESSGVIAQVGFEKTIEIKPLPDPDSTDGTQHTPKDQSIKNRLASIHEIEKLSKSFPAESIIKYKRSVEPQMIRNCANAGCHSSRDKQMALLNLGRGVAVPKRLSQRNLHTLMSFVDLDNPLESPLYLYATQAHADLPKAVYTPERGQTKVLREWLLSISTDEAKLAYYQKQAEEMEQAKIAAKSGTATQEIPGQLALPGEVRQTSADLPAGSIPSIPDLQSRKKAFVPRDPFDPEIFNRKGRID